MLWVWAGEWGAARDGPQPRPLASDSSWWSCPCSLVSSLCLRLGFSPWVIGHSLICLYPGVSLCPIFPCVLPSCIWFLLPGADAAYSHRSPRIWSRFPGTFLHPLAPPPWHVPSPLSSNYISGILSP
uniref:Uncharacterized protein n=1 Tax=Rousettus aegyptiacus TaxID=9407 RepID=A0A7J8CIG0_ROUAE|nr:hypothetical protein HJG63_009102 [Rousettus aegyptiacus]